MHCDRRGLRLLTFLWLIRSCEGFGEIKVRETGLVSEKATPTLRFGASSCAAAATRASYYLHARRTLQFSQE